MSDDPRVRRALTALGEVVAELLARHPLGHLAHADPSRRGGRRLDLRLSVPMSAGEPDDELVTEAREALTHGVDELLGRRAIFRPGQVYCHRCGRTDCEHSAPGEPRQIFAGYGPSGLPRFADFAQWLLERKHPNLDRLYQKPPRLITEVVSGRELHAEMLEEFHDRERDVRIHGQVVAGWFEVPAKGGARSSVALTLQVVSAASKPRRSAARRSGDSQRRKGRPWRHLALGVLARGPGDEPIEHLYQRLGAPPWAAVVRWAQQALDSIELSQRRKSATPEHLSNRIEGVLKGVARRLEQGRRARDRRTGHAEQRHGEGDRPTRMALQDVAQARSEDFLVDTRRNTMVVLGARGRAHVWNGEGKLVTSIRYSPESIGRKKRKEIWRPARSDEVATLRKRLGVAARRSGDVVS